MKKGTILLLASIVLSIVQGIINSETIKDEIRQTTQENFREKND